MPIISAVIFHQNGSQLLLQLSIIARYFFVSREWTFLTLQILLKDNFHMCYDQTHSLGPVQAEGHLLNLHELSAGHLQAPHIFVAHKPEDPPRVGGTIILAPFFFCLGWWLWSVSSFKHSHAPEIWEHLWWNIFRARRHAHTHANGNNPKDWNVWMASIFSATMQIVATISETRIQSRFTNRGNKLTRICSGGPLAKRFSLKFSSSPLEKINKFPNKVCFFKCCESNLPRGKWGKLDKRNLSPKQKCNLRKCVRMHPP